MKRHFVMLDGCRGIAAIMVALSHATEWVGIGTPPFAFLALDFFFMLSGFVIAFAYEDRLRSTMTASEFLFVRVRRLHPLLILGGVLGTCHALLRDYHHGQTQLALTATLFVLGIALWPFHPSPPDWRYDGRDNAFPLNGPTWSMFAEYGANIFYAVIIRHLTNRRLAAIIAISAIAMIGITFEVGTLAFGFRQKHILLALFRVSCPFLIGVALCRLYRAGAFEQWRIPLLTPCAILLIDMAMPGIVPSIPYALISVFVVMPAVIVSGILSDPTRETRSRTMVFLGRVSYPLYAIHAPILFALAPAAHFVPAPFKPVLVAAMMGIVVIAGWAADRFYDVPVRRWLTVHRARVGSKASATS